MRRTTLSLTVALVTATGPGMVRSQAPEPQPARNAGADVRKVFTARCAACHGPELEVPKGRFGYVLDLRRVAGNREMVVPFEPDQSELWVLVQRNEMPPADSPGGPLTEAEKETIRTWIAAGATDAVDAASSDNASPATAEAPAVAEPSARSTAWRTVVWLGKLHLLLLHFPIALVLAAALGELVAAWRKRRVATGALVFCLDVAAVATVPTVALGWAHASAGNGHGSPGLLLYHRWLGTVAGLWLIGTALCARRDRRVGRRSRGTRLALAIAVALVAATGHLGGLMVHGGDFYDW